MRILVLGANGQVGSRLVAMALDRGHEIAGTSHTSEPALAVPLHQHDVREWPPEAVDLSSFDAVCNCVAMTDVDACEGDRERAMAVNATAPGEIAAACEDAGTPFMHLSTDYVFDGTALTPYAEGDEPRPVQVYGESKLAGERRVREAHPEALVLRLSFVYGRHGATGDLTGFPAWLRGRLERGERTPLFTDQHVSPSRAESVATTALSLLTMSETGLFHVACRSCVTPFEFGRELADRLGYDTDALLAEGTQADVDRPATRPTYTCLDTTKLQDTLDQPVPTLREAVATLCDQL